MLPSAVDGFEPDRRRDVATLHQPHERLRGSGIADLAERANGLDLHAGVRAT